MAAGSWTRGFPQISSNIKNLRYLKLIEPEQIINFKKEVKRVVKSKKLENQRTRNSKIRNFLLLKFFE